MNPPRVSCVGVWILTWTTTCLTMSTRVVADVTGTVVMAVWDTLWSGGRGGGGEGEGRRGEDEVGGRRGGGRGEGRGEVRE